MVVWDTTLVSRIYPGGALESRLLEHRLADDPVAVAAPTIMEVTRGIQGGRLPDRARDASLRWLASILSAGLLEVLPLDRHAATLAGRLRGIQPAPPAGATRSGSKPERRAAWILDIQIAACAWTHGRPLVTANAVDFDRLAEMISHDYPGSPPLRVERAKPAER